MVSKIFQEFAYSRVITNIFLVFILVGKNFLTPFFPLYLKYLRLSALEAGIVCGAQALAEMVMAPVWIFSVRRSRDSHKKRALIVISLILTAAIYVCLVFVPPSGTPDDVTHCMPPLEPTVQPPAAPLTTVTASLRPPNVTQMVSPTPSTPPTSTWVPVTTPSPRVELPSTLAAPDLTEAPAVQPPSYREPEDGAEYSQYGEEEGDMTSAKRRPPVWGTWDTGDTGGTYYDDPWTGRKLQSLSLEGLEDASWLSSPVFRAAFVLSTLSAALGCLAEPAVATLWAQRLDDAEHLEQRGEHVVWARFVTSITLTLLCTLMTFLSPCFVARGLHQTVVHPLAAAGTLAGASLLALVLLPLPSGKLPAVTGLPKTHSVTPVSGARRVSRGVATLLAGAAVTGGSLFLMWFVSTLPPQGFRHNYELLYGGFAALEALCAVPVLGWSKSPAAANSAAPGRAALGLLVLALQFGLAPLLLAPAPLPLLGALQGAGGALLERSMGRAYGSSSWRLGCALGAVGAGVTLHVAGPRHTMWGAAVLAIVAALAVVVTGRSPPSRRRRRAYSRLLLAEAPNCGGPSTSGSHVGGGGSSGGTADEALSDSEDGESDWLERALRDDDGAGVSIS